MSAFISNSVRESCVRMTCAHTCEHSLMYPKMAVPFILNDVDFLHLSVQRKIYKDQAEMMLVSHVYPEFVSPSGFLRARVSIQLGSLGFDL